MTAPNPIAPDDSAALAKITAGYVAKGWTSEIGLMIASNCASAVARAVCPVDCVVVRTDDLRAVLEAFVWVCEAYAGEYGSNQQGRDAMPDSTPGGFDLGIYDRLRGKVGDQ